MSFTLVPTELIVDGAITSAKLDTNISISGTLGVTGEVTLATHLNMGDNDKIKIGAGGDLEIYHDGANSYIANSTGNIYIADTNGAVHIQAKLNEESIVCAADGAVTLYHDNSAKLATTATGVDVTGNISVPDNGAIRLGDSQDLLIYHDGSDSYVQDVGTGGLILKSGSTMALKTPGDENMIHMTANAAVKLYYDNSEKLATTATGVDVTGTLTATTLAGTLSTAAQPNITSVGTLTGFTSTGIDDNADATAITIDSSENVGFGETSPLGKIHAKVSDTGASASAQGNLLVLEDTENGLSILSHTSGAGYINFGDSDDNDIGMIIYDHSANAMRFWTNTTERMRVESDGDVTVYGTFGTNSSTAFASMGGRIQFDTDYSDTQRGPNKIVLQEDSSWIAGIGISNGATDFYTGGAFTFRTGTSLGTERMRLDSSGNLLVGKEITNTNTNGLTVSPNDFVSYTNSATDSGDRCMVLNRHAVNAGDILSFRTQNADRGIISFNGSVMSYGGTSDYRLKENIKPMENGLERLNRLNPVSFNWKDTGMNSEGFIAHEVQEVFADVVTGEKDGKQMQTVDYGRITPLLVKAIQEQQAVIEDLKTRIETLEG
jgi:hypothetical protein